MCQDKYIEDKKINIKLWKFIQQNKRKYVFTKKTPSVILLYF